MGKVIKSETEYQDALAELGTLMMQDPEPGTSEADRLELLALVIQDYEARAWPPELVDPVRALEFRMEQQGLTSRDLMPYLGSRSRVSEVLAGKRPLTKDMIRALHDGLGIPLKALIGEGTSDKGQVDTPEWDRFPIKEMLRRGWLPRTGSAPSAEILMRQFLEPLGSFDLLTPRYRHSAHIRSARGMDTYALRAWTARIVMTSRKESLPEYRPGIVNPEFMRQLTRMSPAEDAPVRAAEFLRQHGVGLVVEPHLPRTYLDGVAVVYRGGPPVIGLTLRHDRLDNFWFCLMHELAHIALHYGQDTAYFYDDLDVGDQQDPREREADELAGEVLVPASAWERSPARVSPIPPAVTHLAQQLHIHPAIVAGKVRHSRNAYRLLSQLVGHGQVRRWFPSATWSTDDD